MEEKRSFRLPRSRIIKRKKDIEFLLKNGGLVRGNICRFFFMPARDHKAAFLVSKKSGNAVVRNRIKRWLRELYRTKRHLTEKECLLAIMVTKDGRELSYAAVERDFDLVLPLIKDCLCNPKGYKSREH